MATQQTFLQFSHQSRYANLIDRQASIESLDMQQPNGGVFVNQIRVP